MVAAVEVQIDGMDRAVKAANRLSGFDRFDLLDTIGRLIQLQTRQRIAVEKEDPDGNAWKENYQGTSILKNTGALEDSIDYHVGAHAITVGSSLVYAGIHQRGGVIKPKTKKALAFTAGGNDYVVKQVTMPARPYIGLSADNRDEIESAVGDFLQEVLVQ